MRQSVRNVTLDSCEIMSGNQLNISITAISHKFNCRYKDFILVGNAFLSSILFNIIHHGECYPQPRSDVRHRQVLLLGLDYSRDVRKKWLSLDSPIKKAYICHEPKCAWIFSNLQAITQCNPVCNQFGHFSVSVKRDFLRAIAVEDIFHPCDVHSFTKCDTDVRNSMASSPYEINANVSSKDCIQNIKAKQ